MQLHRRKSDDLVDAVIAQAGDVEHLIRQQRLLAAGPVEIRVDDQAGVIVALDYHALRRDRVQRPHVVPRIGLDAGVEVPEGRKVLAAQFPKLKRRHVIVRRSA